MSSLAAFLAVALCVVLAAAQTPPTLPQTFTANVKITNSLIPFPMNGKLSYDYPNLKQRIDLSGFGGGSEIDRYDEMLKYSFAGPSCKCAPLNDTMPNYAIFPGSTFVGFQTISGANCSGWLVKFFGISTITLWADVQKNVLVEANVTITPPSEGPFPSGPIVTLMSFSNVVAGPIASSVFEPPASCANSCPTPPPYVPSGSCPNSPAPGCSCLTASLTFCSAVNYPLLEATVSNNPSFQDSFVSQAYGAMVSAFPAGTSQTCLDNLKAYLCAFYFPSCGTDGMSFLPCANLCPTCSCTDNPASQCPTVGSSCTAYGTQSFCSSQ